MKVHRFEKPEVTRSRDCRFTASAKLRGEEAERFKRFLEARSTTTGELVKTAILAYLDDNEDTTPEARAYEGV